LELEGQEELTNGTLLPGRELTTSQALLIENEYLVPSLRAATEVDGALELSLCDKVMNTDVSTSDEQA